MPLRPMRDVPPVPPAGQPMFLTAWLAEVRRQPILDRQACIIGFENLARFDGSGKPAIYSPIHWELDLGLCDVVMLDLFDLGIAWRGDETFMSDHYARLMERLYQFIHRYPVELVAEKVETDWQYEVAKGLPFKLFQGYRLGRPERV